ncbi:MAG: phosphatase domain-containing protein [Tetrasphaera sp.]
MAKPHAAAVLEDRWNAAKSAALARSGWTLRFIGFTGYGSTGHVRVLARLLMTRHPHDVEEADAVASPLQRTHALRLRRGWRSFLTTPAMNTPVTIEVGARTIRARTDRSGILDVLVADHDLPPGWHTANLTTASGVRGEAPLVITDPQTTFGIVSDIDDTVIKTMLPRPLIAAWNTFVRHEGARKAVPGMATLYRDLLQRHPGAPIVYVSTGAWNTVPQLTRFLTDKGYPLGPLLMTDWGPTNTGWFRSGQDHKRACLHRLARELPQIEWVLIGDDGQHDPSIYGEFAEQRPETVRAIAIRVLSAREQLLSHFTPVASDPLGPTRRRRATVPICRASDGYGLARLLCVALDGMPVPSDVVVEN